MGWRNTTLATYHFDWVLKTHCKPLHLYSTRQHFTNRGGRALHICFLVLQRLQAAATRGRLTGRALVIEDGAIASPCVPAFMISMYLGRARLQPKVSSTNDVFAIDWLRIQK